MTAPQSLRASAAHHPQHLRGALVSSAHALLLHGVPGVGRRALARALAAAPHCREDGAPCLRCQSCRAFLAGEHPDLLELAPRAVTAAGKVALRPTIPVGMVAESRDDRGEFDRHLDRFLEVQGRTGPRAVLIDGAEALTPEAANAMLKLLEEPPHGARFFLVAQDRGAVLPTVASRASPLAVPPLPEAELRARFPEAGEELLAFAAGRPGLLEHAQAVGALLEEARRLVNALPDLGEALTSAAALGGEFHPLHPEALRFALRTLPLPAQAAADRAIAQAVADREAYVNAELLWAVLALELRLALGHAE